MICALGVEIMDVPQITEDEMAAIKKDVSTMIETDIPSRSIVVPIRKGDRKKKKKQMYCSVSFPFYYFFISLHLVWR